MWVDDKKMEQFINAALMNCMDLNYYIFNRKFCDDCNGCPLDNFENSVRWLSENKDTAPHEMTNAQFQEKLKQECENNEELREEINEIIGIFRRAIAKSYPNFENREVIEDESK